MPPETMLNRDDGHRGNDATVATSRPLIFRAAAGEAGTCALQ